MVAPLPYGPDKRLRYAADGSVLPPNGGKGRPFGSKDRVSKTLKEAILLAAEWTGDELAEAAAEGGKDRPGGLMGYLCMVATSDVKAFAALLGRVLPMEVSGVNGGALEVVFRTVYEDAGATARVVSPGLDDAG